MNHIPAEIAEVRNPSELIAAVPHLLRYHPSDAIMVVSLTGNNPYELLSIVGASLPLTDHLEAAHELAVSARRDEATAAIVMAIGHGEPQPADLPHQDIIATIDDELTAHGVRPIHAFWAASTAEASPWHCYDEPNCGGVVADAGRTSIAAASVAAGRVTFASRADMADNLKPDDDKQLALRAGQIAQLMTDIGAAEPGDYTAASQEGFHAVGAAIQLAAAGQLELTEDRIARLAVALSIWNVRDAYLAVALTDQAHAAEQLWTALTRSVPAPYRAEPAVLLAFTAYLRGEGTLASMALTVAEETQPGHVLTLLLQLMLNHGLPADMIAEDIVALAADARRVLEIDPAEA